MANYKSTDAVNTYAVGDTVEFDYTGNADIFKVMNATKFKIEAYGAQGGGVDGIVTGGLGAYATGELDFTAMAGKIPSGIIVKVGGTPSKSTVTIGQTNYQIADTPAVIGGGGNSIVDKGCAGGGASDVRLILPDGTADATPATSLASRIIVAGAGAGASYTRDKGLVFDMYGGIINVEYYRKQYQYYIDNKITYASVFGSHHNNMPEAVSDYTDDIYTPDKWITEYIDTRYGTSNTNPDRIRSSKYSYYGYCGGNSWMWNNGGILTDFRSSEYIYIGRYNVNISGGASSIIVKDVYARKEYSVQKIITDLNLYFDEFVMGSDGAGIINMTGFLNQWIPYSGGGWFSGPIYNTSPHIDVSYDQIVRSNVANQGSNSGTGLSDWTPGKGWQFNVEYTNLPNPKFGEDKIKSGIQGGHGGNFYGSVSSSTSSGATQYNGGTWFGGEPANNGSLEIGGSPTANFKGGGGGGGYYGGAAGDPATGGVSFASGDPQCPTKPNPIVILSNTSAKPGVNTGDGKVIFTITEIIPPVPVSPPPPNPKVNHKLCIRKNGIVQKASLYANPIKQPRLAVRNGSAINYAVLSKKKTPGSIDLTVTKNNVQYWVQVTGDPDYTFSLDNKVTRDGGSFRCLPVQYDGYGVPLCYVLGQIIVDQVSTFKIEIDYNYYSNEPRGGTDGVGLLIDLIQNTTSNNLVWTSYQSSQQQNYSFKGTFNITLNPGVYNIAFTGYKPRWHSCESATGTIKLYMI